MTPGEALPYRPVHPLLDFEATALALWRQIGNWPGDTVPWDKIRLIAEALCQARLEGYSEGLLDGRKKVEV